MSRPGLCELRLRSGAALAEGELCLSQHWSLALRSGQNPRWIRPGLLLVQ